MALFRKAYSVVGVLLLLDLVAQFFLIGAAMFTIFNEASNGSGADRALSDSGVYLIAHTINGAAMAVLILVLVGLSFGSRYPWRTTGLTALLFLLLVVQSVLAHTGIAPVSALHAVNGLVIVGLTGSLTGSHWAFGSAQVGAGVPPPAVLDRGLN